MLNGQPLARSTYNAVMSSYGSFDIIFGLFSRARSTPPPTRNVHAMCGMLYFVP